MKRFILLEGLFDYNTLSKNKTISAAVTRWLEGFLENVNYVFIGHEYQRVWPLGKLYLKSKKYEKGLILGYQNIYMLRKVLIFIKYFVKTFSLLNNSKTEDTLIVHSCLEHKNELTIQILIARFFKWFNKVNVICIVGDGYEPEGFDSYFFVSYHTYILSNKKNKILFEGVVQNKIKNSKDFSSKKNEKLKLVYSGAIDGHVSLKNLVLALRDEKFTDKYELIITGICSNKELINFFDSEKNVSYKGFLTNEELFEISSKADLFINPRRIDFLPNEFNFPSKLLYYMQFDKPIISSVTKGVSPEFLEFLIPIEGDSVENFKKAISNFNDQSDENLKDRLKKQIILKKKLSKENAQKLLNQF